MEGRGGGEAQGPLTHKKLTFKATNTQTGFDLAARKLQSPP
jgi:hypothetical protein